MRVAHFVRCRIDAFEPDDGVARPRLLERFGQPRVNTATVDRTKVAAEQ